MRESDVRRKVVGLLKEAGLDPQPVENRAEPGAPDVEYLDGWIEIKLLRSWPKRPETVVRFSAKAFRPAQRIWLRRRVRAGGRAHLLLAGPSEWLLFRGDVAADEIGFRTRRELFIRAIGCWAQPPTAAAFVHALGVD